MFERRIVERLHDESWAEALMFTAGDRFEEADDLYQHYVGCGERPVDAVDQVVDELKLQRSPERDTYVDKVRGPL